MNPTTLNQYVSAGSYQLSSSSIKITITALCKQSNGSSKTSMLTYSSEEANSIGDISNIEGTLTIAKGNGGTPNPTNNYNEYIPAGSYQLTSSDINIEIEADCKRSNGSSNRSEVKISTNTSISDIANIEGDLQVIK